MKFGMSIQDLHKGAICHEERRQDQRLQHGLGEQRRLHSDLRIRLPDQPRKRTRQSESQVSTYDNFLSKKQLNPRVGLLQNLLLQLSEWEPRRRGLLDPGHRLRDLLRGVLVQPGRLPQAGAWMGVDEAG